MKRKTEKNKVFDLIEYQTKYSDAELFCIRIGTLGLITALQSRRPLRAATIASSIARRICHPDPRHGDLIKKGKTQYWEVPIR